MCIGVEYTCVCVCVGSIKSITNEVREVGRFLIDNRIYKNTFMKSSALVLLEVSRQGYHF